MPYQVFFSKNKRLRVIPVQQRGSVLAAGAARGTALWFEHLSLSFPHQQKTHKGSNLLRNRHQRQGSHHPKRKLSKLHPQRSLCFCFPLTLPLLYHARSGDSLTCCENHHESAARLAVVLQGHGNPPRTVGAGGKMRREGVGRPHRAEWRNQDESRGGSSLSPLSPARACSCESFTPHLLNGW